MRFDSYTARHILLDAARLTRRYTTPLWRLIFAAQSPQPRVPASPPARRHFRLHATPTELRSPRHDAAAARCHA